MLAGDVIVIEELAAPVNPVAFALMTPDPLVTVTLSSPSFQVATPDVGVFARLVEVDNTPHVALPFFDSVTVNVEAVQVVPPESLIATATDPKELPSVAEAG